MFEVPRYLDYILPYCASIFNNIRPPVLMIMDLCSWAGVSAQTDRLRQMKVVYIPKRPKLRCGIAALRPSALYDVFAGNGFVDLVFKQGPTESAPGMGVS